MANGSRSVITVDSFFPKAKALRGSFEERFANPHGADSGRFVWDWWHVPGQYTVLRTPAYHFFPPALYRAFHERLVLWGRENLGCHDVSPPWLSCYVDGCRQDFHSDLPHGPWAFVYSLTPWDRRKFTGGETFLLRDEMLGFWGNLGRFRALEEQEILRTVEPRFDRLTVFDPRIPHGVRRVEGALDPREGRLVIHGWFVQPRPFISGPLPRAALQKGIDAIVGELGSFLADRPPLRGILSLRFNVSPAGKVSGCRVLSNTVRSPEGAEQTELARFVTGLIGELRFPARKAASSVTLPLVLED